MNTYPVGICESCAQNDHSRCLGSEFCGCACNLASDENEIDYLTTLARANGAKLSHA